MLVTWSQQVPFFNGIVEFQALDGHGGPPVGVLRLEHGAEAPPAQVVQVRQLLAGDHRQGAGQTADVHTAHSRVRLHSSLWAFTGTHWGFILHWVSLWKLNCPFMVKAMRKSSSIHTHEIMSLMTASKLSYCSGGLSKKRASEKWFTRLQKSKAQPKTTGNSGTSHPPVYSWYAAGPASN